MSTAASGTWRSAARPRPEAVRAGKASRPNAEAGAPMRDRNQRQAGVTGRGSPPEQGDRCATSSGRGRSAPVPEIQRIGKAPDVADRPRTQQLARADRTVRRRSRDQQRRSQRSEQRPPDSARKPTPGNASQASEGTSERPSWPQLGLQSKENAERELPQMSVRAVEPLPSGRVSQARSSVPTPATRRPAAAAGRRQHRRYQQVEPFLHGQRPGVREEIQLGTDPE